MGNSYQKLIGPVTGHPKGCKKGLWALQGPHVVPGRPPRFSSTHVCLLHRFRRPIYPLGLVHRPHLSPLAPFGASTGLLRPPEALLRVPGPPKSTL